MAAPAAAAAAQPPVWLQGFLKHHTSQEEAWNGSQRLSNFLSEDGNAGNHLTSVFHPNCWFVDTQSVGSEQANSLTVEQLQEQEKFPCNSKEP